MTTISEIDVSYWDAGIDWTKVCATGQRFMFAKATEGITYKVPTFDDNWFGAKSAGLLRGDYHFFRCNVDAKKQADYFIDYVKTVKDNGELPPVLDLETNDGMTSTLLSWIFYNSDRVKALKFYTSVIWFELPIDLYF